ncbi:hypothetical protein METHPM2_180059 [Pseudomonas sp. PM2]
MRLAILVICQILLGFDPLEAARHVRFSQSEDMVGRGEMSMLSYKLSVFRRHPTPRALRVISSPQPNPVDPSRCRLKAHRLCVNVPPTWPRVWSRR